MIDEEIEERASLWVLGLLEEGEAARFAAAMRENPELAELTASLQHALDQLVMEVPQHTPPAHLKERVLSRIRGEELAPVLRGNRSSSWLGWAAAAAFFCGCAALLFERGHLRTEVATLRQRDSLATVEIVRLASQLAEVPKAGAVAMWDAEHQRGVLDLADLPALREDQDYQLWLVDPAYADPVDGGIIRVGDNAGRRVSFEPKKPVRNLAKLAVSRERRGGVPKAEGPMVLLSE